MEELQYLASGNNFLTVLIGLAALAGLFLLVCKVIEEGRKLRKPVRQRDDDAEAQRQSVERQSVERRFLNDQNTLHDHETRISRLEEGQIVQCEALRTLLEHEIHNGNEDEMREASKKLFNFLNHKP